MSEGGFKLVLWGGHIVEGCVLLSSAFGCIGTLIYGSSILGTEKGIHTSLKCGSGVFGYRFVGGRIRQHGGDFGVVGLSIHNYTGMTFVSWDYYKADYGKVLLQSSLRSLDSADLPLLRIPMT